MSLFDKYLEESSPIFDMQYGKDGAKLIEKFLKDHPMSKYKDIETKPPQVQKKYKDDLDALKKQLNITKKSAIIETKLNIYEAYDNGCITESEKNDLLNILNEIYTTEGFISSYRANKIKKAEEKRKAEEAAYKASILDMLNSTLKYVKSPYLLGDGGDSDILATIKIAGVSSDVFAKYISKHKGSLKSLDKSWYAGENLNNKQTEMFTKSLSILENDDYCMFVSLVDNKLYYIDYDYGKLSIHKESLPDLLDADSADVKMVSKDNGDILSQIYKTMSK